LYPLSRDERNIDLYTYFITLFTEYFSQRITFYNSYILKSDGDNLHIGLQCVCMYIYNMYKCINIAAVWHFIYLLFFFFVRSTVTHRSISFVSVPLFKPDFGKDLYLFSLNLLKSGFILIEFHYVKSHVLNVLFNFAGLVSIIVRAELSKTIFAFGRMARTINCEIMSINN
jgi:hypothetical protein